MPELDRRITVRLTVTTVNAFGETVETTTDYPQWAQLIQDRLARNIEVGGIYATADRVWRIRFNQAIVDAHATEGSISVLPGDGADADIITGVGEPVTPDVRRRRFLDLLS